MKFFDAYKNLQKKKIIYISFMAPNPRTQARESGCGWLSVMVVWTEFFIKSQFRLRDPLDVLNITYDISFKLRVDQSCLTLL